MKLALGNQGFEGNVPAKRIHFKISSNASLFSILSDGIYKDKIYAVIRELSCNAEDIHVFANQRTPWRAQVPTMLDPTFMVEDFGTGIDPERIGDIFWTYGDSTKTADNRQIGALGLGSKSPFAYTKSSFTVENRFNGKKHVYFCFVNEEGRPDGSEISCEPTTEPNGIKVELAVRSEDVCAFQERMQRFFKYWDVLPEFVGSELEVKKPAITYEGKNWYHEKIADRYSVDAKALAIMGNVPYPIDIGSIPRPSANLRFVAANSFRIKFPLGAISFQASREELSYDEGTVKALEAEAAKLVTEFRAIVKEAVEGPNQNKTNNELWKSYNDKISTVQLNELDYIGGLFNSGTKFKSATDLFTGQELAVSEVKLEHPGSSLFPICEIVRYSQTSVSLINKRKVVMVKTTDNKGAPRTDSHGDCYTLEELVGKSGSVTTAWYNPQTTVPRVTRWGNQPADYLRQGLVPAKTRMVVPLTTKGIPFVVNDVGPRGRDAARLMGRARSFLFVDIPQGSTIAEAEAEIKAMTVGTLLSGVEFGLLSKQDDFKLPPAPEKDPTAPKVRGQIEVRSISYTDKNHSVYERIDPVGFEAYYILADKEEMKEFRARAEIFTLLIKWNVQDFKNAKFICRNADDIALLTKRGAKLTHAISNDVLEPATIAKLQVIVDKLKNANDAKDGDYESRQVLDNLTNNMFNGFPGTKLEAYLKAWKDLNKLSLTIEESELNNVARRVGIKPSPNSGHARVSDIVLKSYPMLQFLANVYLDGKKKALIKNYVATTEAV